MKEHPNAKTQEISFEIGLKQSRTKVYLAELVEDGKIIADGANKNRTYSLSIHLKHKIDAKSGMLHNSFLNIHKIVKNIYKYY